MKKIFILCVLSLLLFGCKAEYSIKINEDLSVDETIIGLEDEEFYSKYYKSTKDRVIDIVTIRNEEYLKKFNYTKEKVVEGVYTGAKATTTFSDLQSYFNSSEAYKQFYSEWKHSIENGIVTIELKDKFEKNGNCLDRYIIDNCDVSISLPFKVVKNNADNYDKNTNTYTWYIDIDEPKDIYIKFDTTKVAKDMSYITYIGIGSIFIVAVFILIKVYINKSEKANKF